MERIEINNFMYNWWSNSSWKLWNKRTKSLYSRYILH